MDHRQFDDLTRALGRTTSRRGLLRGLAAGLAAAVVWPRATGARRAKVPVCHFTGSANNPWKVIAVPEPAYQSHLAHGDQPYVDCCDDGACPGAFQTCGGGGTPGACGCAPDCAGKACGADDGCGGVCLEGECPTGQACGYPDPGVCGCGPVGCLTCVGTGFVTSDNGQCIFRQCAPGTVCHQVTDCNIICDFP